MRCTQSAKITHSGGHTGAGRDGGQFVPDQFDKARQQVALAHAPSLGRQPTRLIRFRAICRMPSDVNSRAPSVKSRLNVLQFFDRKHCFSLLTALPATELDPKLVRLLKLLWNCVPVRFGAIASDVLGRRHATVDCLHLITAFNAITRKPSYGESCGKPRRENRAGGCCPGGKPRPTVPAPKQRRSKRTKTLEGSRSWRT